ncbi:hypothetical protein [Mycolicibacterium chlorophenolicum]|uniref:Uncharacterized protein n=1 Tax=Mycolicibacterium chlorophenolicum TaxID=37916 RepID=A0A0J6WH72_9MYCO|nr:hypothetical protein [Mycolicibacterium chlorophenolicum]KMO82600.1 hypothetical protein MCHLDSM_01223 [Mycolicibacterium chlorophenolicum]
MDTTRKARRWWLIAATLSIVAWFLGAYLSPVSNLWVWLNLLTPAGHPHLTVLPLAYPAVGIDGHTLTSLFGLVLVIGAATRWISYLELFNPPTETVEGTAAPSPNLPLPPRP